MDLVLVLTVSLLFLYTFKGPFNTNLIYFTFIKSVAIKNKRRKNSKPDMTKATLLLEKFDVNVPLILKINQKECFVCIL